MGPERGGEFRATLQPADLRAFVGLSKTDKDILGKLDLTGIGHEEITERACLMPASAALMGAPGCCWGPQDSRCTARLLGQEV